MTVLQLHDILVAFERAEIARRRGEFDAAMRDYSTFVDRSTTALIEDCHNLRLAPNDRERLLRLARAATGVMHSMKTALGRWPELAATSTSEASEAKSADFETSPAAAQSTVPIFGFFHLALAPGWQAIVEELLADLRESGLLSRCERLFFGVLGPDMEALEFEEPNVEIAFRSSDFELFEFATLERVHQHSQTNEGHYFYIHSKGVFSRHQHPTVDDWRRYMAHFVVCQHESCTTYLRRGFDVAGVNWQATPYPHFSGNFWWATAEYLRTLPAPMTLRIGPDARCGAERWLGQNDAVRVACLHQSLINHYECPYPERSYITSPPDKATRTSETVVDRVQDAPDVVLALQSILTRTKPVALMVSIGGALANDLALAIPSAQCIWVDDSEPAGPMGQSPTPLGPTDAKHPIILESSANVHRWTMSIAEAAQRLNYPIDLLEIDIAESSNVTEEVFRIWESKLRPGGCTLFHGIDRHQQDRGHFFWQLPGEKSVLQAGAGVGFWCKPFDSRTPAGPAARVNQQRLLSILTPTLGSRQKQFERLHQHLVRQITDNGLAEQVEFLWFLDNREHSVGDKRNTLMYQATGRFVVFIDDDDEVDDEYVVEVCRVLREYPDVDCVGFTGELVMPDAAPQPTIYSLRYQEPSNATLAEGLHVYLRPPQHVNPMRRDIAIQFPFPSINLGEDFARARDLAQRAPLKREYFLGNRVMYRYLFDPQQTETQRRIPAKPPDQTQAP